MLLLEFEIKTTHIPRAKREKVREICLRSIQHKCYYDIRLQWPLPISQNRTQQVIYAYRTTAFVSRLKSVRFKQQNRNVLSIE